jgi:hypothetical protein
MDIKQTAVALTLMFTASVDAQAARLSEFQGREGIPDSPINNCVRQAMIDHANGGEGMTQNSYVEKGITVYHFESAGPNGAETFINVKMDGSRTIEIDTIKGNPTERKNALIQQISRCM